MLEPVRILGCALRSCNQSDESEPMLREAVAQGGAGRKGAQGSKNAREVSREGFCRLPIAPADAADRRMRVTVKGCFTRSREGAIEIIKGRKRDGAKDRKLERPRRGFDLVSASARSGPSYAREARDKRAA